MGDKKEGKRSVNVLKLPMPDNMERVEACVMQFGDDLPGIFMRWDQARAHAVLLDDVIEILEHYVPERSVEIVCLKLMACGLEACDGSRYEFRTKENPDE